EVAFEFAQTPREFERASGRERGTGDCVLALAHERLKFPPVAARARGDARGEHVDRRAGRDPAVARERAARARVYVFDGEVVGARALLQLGHRGDEFEFRAAVGALRGPRAREASATRPPERQNY